MVLKKQKTFKELPIEVGKTYQTKWATKEKFTVTEDQYIRNDKGEVIRERFQVFGIFENSPELGPCPLNVDRLILDKVVDGEETICSNCNEVVEGSTKFKTLVTPNGEFGLLDTEVDPNDRLFIATSSTPTLFPATATLEALKANYNGTILSHWDMDIPDGEVRYDWDIHTPDWRLVDVELNIT